MQGGNLREKKKGTSKKNKTKQAVEGDTGHVFQRGFPQARNKKAWLCTVDVGRHWKGDVERRPGAKETAS